MASSSKSNKIKPPVVAEEDNWPAGDGYPRWVRCRRCHHWREWRYICEKGALEGRPVGDGLECWWCYTQRIGGGVTWGEVKKLFARLYAKDRGHRVAQWQNLLWYVTDPEVENSAAKPAEARYRTKKRAYDDLRAEQTAFRNDGGGSANIDDLNVDDKVKFKSKDQYVGINDVEFEGIECVLFNWASTTNRTKKNAAMATLANKETKDVITKGRALEGHIAAHNLCVVTDSCAVGAIRQQFDAAQAYSAFAIGGEYRDPTDKRGKAEHYCGIQLMGLKRHKHKPCETWSSVEWTVLQRLIKGDHPGAVEGRSKCIRSTDGRGIAEFDGQSALTYWRGEFLVYARANPRERGYRAVQVCRGQLNSFKPFQLCQFTDVPAASDIYFLHPYVLPGGKCIAVIMSLVWPDGDGSPPKEDGIYLALSKDGVNFHRPELLHSCKSHGRRAYDLPIQGNVSFTESGIELLVHQNVHCRMDSKDWQRPEKLVRVRKALEPYICALWSAASQNASGSS